MAGKKAGTPACLAKLFWCSIYEQIRTDFQAEPDPAPPDALNGGG